MGMVFGKIGVETPKYEVLKSTKEYEIRKYPPSLVAEITYQMKNDKDAGFLILAQYIGVFGKPQNTSAQSIAMTAPVITQHKTPPVPVVMVTSSKSAEAEAEVTMRFILPSKYKSVEEAPKPVDERVLIKEEVESLYAVLKFSGFASDDVVKEKAQNLKDALDKDDEFKIAAPALGEADYFLARYNPPWTLPMFKTNEVMIPVIHAHA